MFDNNTKEQQKVSQFNNQNQSNESHYSSQKSHIRKLEQQKQMWSPISKKSYSQNKSSINNSKDFYVNVLHCPSENSFQVSYQKSQQISQKLNGQPKEEKKQFDFNGIFNLNSNHPQPALAQSNVNIILGQNQSPKTQQIEKNLSNKKKNQSQQASIEKQKNLIQDKLKELEDLRLSFKVSKLKQETKINGLQKQLSQLSIIDKQSIKSQKSNQSDYLKYYKTNENQKIKRKISQQQIRQSNKRNYQNHQKSQDSPEVMQIKIKNMIQKLKVEYKQLNQNCKNKNNDSFKKSKNKQDEQKKIEQKVESSILNYLERQGCKNIQQEKQLQNLRNINKKLLNELSTVKNENQYNKNGLQSYQSSLKQQSKKSSLQQNGAIKENSIKQVSSLKSQIKQKENLLNQKQFQIEQLKEKVYDLQSKKQKNIKLQEITKQFESIKTSNVNMYEYTFDLEQQIARLKDSREQSYIKMRKTIQKEFQQKLDKKIQQLEARNKEFTINPKHKTTNQILLNQLIHSNQSLQKQINQLNQKNNALEKQKMFFEEQAKNQNLEIKRLNTEIFNNKKTLKEKQAFIQQLQTKIFTIEEELLYLSQSNNQSQTRRSLQINQNQNMSNKQFKKSDNNIKGNLQKKNKNSTSIEKADIYIQEDNSIIEAINNHNTFSNKNINSKYNSSYQLQELQQKLIQIQQQLKFRQNYLKQRQKQLSQKEKQLILKEESIYQIQLKVQSECRKINMRKHELENQYQQILSKYNEIKKKENTIILQKCNQYLNINTNSQYGLKAGLNNYFKNKNSEENSVEHLFTNKQILIQEQPNNNRYISQLSTSRSQRSRSNSLQADKIISKMRANGNLASINTCNCHRNGVSCRCFTNSRQKSNNKLCGQIKSPTKIVIQQRKTSPNRQNKQTIRSSYYTVKEGKSPNHQNDMRKRQDKNLKLKIIQDKVKRIKNEAGIISK